MNIAVNQTQKVDVIIRKMLPQIQEKLEMQKHDTISKLITEIKIWRILKNFERTETD